MATACSSCHVGAFGKLLLVVLVCHRVAAVLGVRSIGLLQMSLSRPESLARRNAESTASSKSIPAVYGDPETYAAQSYSHPVSKNAASPWGQIWVTVFGAGQGVLSR